MEVFSGEWVFSAGIRLVDFSLDSRISFGESRLVFFFLVFLVVDVESVVSLLVVW